MLKTSKRKGKEVSDLAVKSASINVYVTNVPSHMLSTEIIHEIYYDHGKQLSEYKAFSVIKSILFEMKQALFSDELALLNLFQLINEIFPRNSIKSRKKDRKTALDIMESVLVDFVAKKGIA